MAEIITGPSGYYAQQHEQPNLVGQLGQILALKQQQQLAPLQVQAAQQNVQAGALENQQKQVALKNQQALTEAYKTWDGNNYADLAHKALQAGATGDAVMALQQHALTVKDTASQIAQRDADTGQKTLQTKIDSNGLIAGKLLSISQLPDEQLAKGVSDTLQEIGPQLDPQHAQMGQQLLQGLQSGQIQPAQAKQQLDFFRKSFLSDKQIYEDVKNQSQTREADARAGEAAVNAKKTQAELDYYAQRGGVPGVPVETQELNDYLSKNPGKGPSDFVAFKAKNSPSVVVQGMSGGVANTPGMQQQSGGTDWAKVAGRYGLSAAAFDQQAEKYFQTGQLPPIGRGSANVIAQNRDLMNRAAELHPNESLAETSAAYKANTDSLKKLQVSLDTVTAFENTANKNIEMLKGIAAKVPDLGARFANVPIRMFTGNMIGSENMAAFKTALAPVQSESAKILNSANLSGQLSDSSRHELQDIVDGNIPYKSLVASLNVLQQDFRNRHDSTAQQIEDIKRRMGGTQQTQSQPSQSAAPIKIKLPSGKEISIE